MTGSLSKMMASLKSLDDLRTATAVNGLLVIACAWLVVRMGVLLVDGVDVEYQPFPFAPAAARTDTLPATDWRMFGNPAEVDYGFERSLPATPLSLRLRGAVTGARGYAIIVDAEGNEGVYRAGDKVPGDAEVVTIEARRVVLERNGTREALELPGASRRAASSAGADQPRQLKSGQEGLASGVGIGSLTAMTSRFRLDPDTLAQRITILPVAGGGFRVRAGRDAAIFTKLGFHANDVVLAINGQPVDNQRDVRAVFESFQPGEPLAITVRRGDRQRVLTPDLSRIGGADSP